MKKIISFIIIILAVSMIFSSCAGSVTENSETASGEKTETLGPDVSVDTTIDTSSFDTSLEATGDFTITPSVSSENSVYTITEGGEYVLTGKLDDGQVVIDAGDSEVTLNLTDVSISCSSGAPILVLNASEVDVKAKAGTYNSIYDNRTGDSTEAEGTDENYDAAIYSACDLKISGKGTLTVETSYDNGIKSKDDLKVKNLTLLVNSSGTSLKGNDTVTIESGNITLVSAGADGIKTSNTDISSKGNQRGDITISGGTVNIYSACDGISSAYNTVISESSETCTVNIYTASYASAAEDVSGAGELYLVIPSSIYDSGTDYYIFFYNDDSESGTWRKCEYETMIYSGWSNSYYGLLVKVPSGYQNFLINTVTTGTSPDGNNYTASSGGETLNTSMNGYMISSVSGANITGDWVSISSGSGSNTNKTTYSSKGIKAYNDVIISGGSVTVYSMDDGIHANAGESLENGSKSTGNVTVSGGKVIITSADDGIHADGNLTISGGYVNVVESHEGLEGNVITVSGGETYVYGDDDGINACAGTSTALVNITGGRLEVTTPSGDTDAIDSNGSFTMSGGTVIVKGGAANGGMAGSVDTDGNITVTGGTIVALGGITSVPANGSVNYYVSSGTSFQAGNYVLKSSDGSEIVSFVLDSSYSSVWIASDAFILNGSYELSKDGSSVLTWTQTSSAEGNYSGGFGGGGFGGGGFGGRR